MNKEFLTEELSIEELEQREEFTSLLLEDGPSCVIKVCCHDDIVLDQE